MQVYRRVPIQFAKELLNELKDDETSCVIIKKQMLHLALHPFHFNDVNNSIKEILNQGIAKYSKELDGILLGYRNIKMFEATAPINDDNCFVHVNIQADFYVFKPEIGKKLIGVVSKKSKDHVGCLVHNVFNVSLPKPAEDTKWIGTTAELGQTVKFKITYMNLLAGLPYIRAKIISISGDAAVRKNGNIQTEEEDNFEYKNKILKFDDDIDNTYTNGDIQDDGEDNLLQESIDDQQDEWIDKSIKTEFVKIRKRKLSVTFDENTKLNFDDEPDVQTKPKKRRKIKEERADTSELHSKISEELSTLTKVLEANREKKPTTKPKVKKERKSSEDIEDITKMLLEKSLQDITESSSKKTKRKKKSKLEATDEKLIAEKKSKRKKKKDASLDDLNLETLFNEEFADIMQSGTSSSKKKSKKSKRQGSPLHEYETPKKKKKA